MSKTFDSMPAKAFFMNSRGLLSLRKRIFKYTVCKDGKLFHSRLSDAILIFLITRKLEKHMAIHKISPSDYFIFRQKNKRNDASSVSMLITPFSIDALGTIIVSRSCFLSPFFPGMGSIGISSAYNVVQKRTTKNNDTNFFISYYF